MYRKIQAYIKTWEQRCYSDGLPDDVPVEIFDRVPSYKRIAVAILKNDVSLKTLGFTPEVSEYYNILKRIELGLPLNKKRSRMTNSETRQYVFELTKELIAKECYIKGYGDQFRICDANHNPVKNISKTIMNILKHNDVVLQDELIHVNNPLFKGFVAPIDVIISDKNS